MGYVSTAIQKIRYLVARDDEQVLILEKNNGVYLEVNLDTQASRDAAITAAVNNLIAGAPGALNTLNELAAALGDDANFAATVTTSLGNRLVWKGAWAPAFDYVRNDLVLFNGGLYVAPGNFTSGASFVKANWTELSTQFGTSVATTAPQTIADGGARARANIGVRQPPIPVAMGLADDFHRANRDLTGDRAPSGHVYRSQGGAGVNMLVNGAYASTVGPAGAAIVYADHELPLLSIAAEVVFSAGTGLIDQQNAVIGSCARTFGSAGDGGSVQLAIWPDGVNGDGTGVNWELFTVADPVVDPYPVLASGNFVSGFSIAGDGSTVYRMAVYRIDVNTVVCELPDGTLHTVTDATIGQRWRNAFGFQLRRVNVTDGYCKFVAVRSGVPIAWRRPQPTPGAVLVLQGNDTDSFLCQQPTVALDGDIDMRGKIRADHWTPAMQMTIAKVWGVDNGNHGFHLFINATGHLVLNPTVDGQTLLGSASSVVLPFSDGGWGWFGVSRTSVDGIVTYYTASSDAALSLPFTDPAWTVLGTTRTTAPGPIYQAAAPLEIGRRLTTIYSNLSGAIAYFGIRKGLNGPVWAELDTRASFSGVDTAGNVWMARGAGWSWELGESQIKSLATDLATINTQLASLSSASAAFASTCDVEQDVVATSAAEFTCFTFATMPANLLKVGTALRMRLAGTVDGVATSGAMTGKVRLGSASGPTLTTFTITQSMTAAQLAKQWMTDCDLMIDAVGSGGSVSLYGLNNGNSAAGANSPTVVEGIGIAADLSGGLTVVVTVLFATANAGNIVRLKRGVLSQVPST